MAHTGVWPTACSSVGRLKAKVVSSPKILSAQAVEQFHSQGYLSPIPVLSEEETAHFRGCLESFEQKFPDDTTTLKSKSHLLCPWVADIARHPAILDVYEDLIGPDILCYSMAFRTKNPDGKTHAGWHQDGAYNPIKPLLVIGALALAGCTVAHGCLRVIPGSHKTGVLPHIDTGNPDSILSRGQYIDADIDESKAVELVLKPGEIGLFNAGIIHCSGVNVTDERRLIVLVEMMPTHTQARAHRDSGMLVRGVDTYGHVDVDPPPSVEFGEVERAAWRHATRKTGKNVFAGSPLEPTEVYGGKLNH
jgi:non-haem Fe2+, alpha-ketoglutarate-dependent halogenase